MSEPMILGGALVESLDEWQYYGQACVRCGRKFTLGERPADVATIGQDAHALRACHACAPLVKVRNWPTPGAV